MLLYTESKTGPVRYVILERRLFTEIPVLILKKKKSEKLIGKIA